MTEDWGDRLPMTSGIGEVNCHQLVSWIRTLKFEEASLLVWLCGQMAEVGWQAPPSSPVSNHDAEKCHAGGLCLPLKCLPSSPNSVSYTHTCWETSGDGLGKG